MDTLTHIVVGACIGEAIAGPALGKRAMFWGAFAHSLPDFDFIAQLWTDTIPGLLVHRGFTHSIFFAVLSTLALTVIVQRLFPRRPLKRWKWFLLFSINIFAHNFLDTFNAYGTGWFEPFAHNRFSFHILYVADPLFSIWPFLAFIVLLIRDKKDAKRKLIGLSGVGLGMLYILFAIYNKSIIVSDLERYARSGKLPGTNSEHIVTPAPFNSLLWYIVVKADSGFYTTYRSVNDDRDRMKFRYFPQNRSLLDSVKDKEELNDLLRFAGDYYTVEKWHDTLVFNVLRFGQVAGWDDSIAKFTFYCFLDRPGSNTLVVQRGRMEGWDRKGIRTFFRRIRGQ